MLRRFCYHAFWNFYDYLGTHTLVGSLYVLILLGLLVLLSLLPLPVGGSFIIGLLIALILTSVAIAALYPFSARVALGEHPRLPQLLGGLSKHLKQVAVVYLLWTIFAIVLIFNLFFYSKVQQEATQAGFQTALIILSAVVGWIAFAWALLMSPLHCAATYPSAEHSLRKVLSRAIMVFTLSPLMWILLLVIAATILLVGIYTRVGLIFVLPVMASLGQTAYHLCVQYAGFLTQARTDIGADRPLKEYRKRANELAWQWEHEQPRRTFKELIRPWEY